MPDTHPPYTVDDFDFDLPPGLIAQHPAPQRSASRLLDGTGPMPADLHFTDLPALLAPGDLLVFNDTRVIKARLFGEKPTGGAVEALVERVLPGTHEVMAHLRASKSPRPGSTVRFAGGAFDAEVLGRGGPDGGLFHLRFPGDPFALLEAHGHVPLPPYITHADGADDVARYQTVFADKPGAVAAPTASLHFDDAVLAALAARGVQRAQVTLHVGAGTFQPVRSATLAEHRMHSEWYDVPQPTVDAITRTRAAGGRIVAAGTTTLRALESAALGGTLRCRRARDRRVHHAGLSLPRGRPAGHQLPPAAQHAADAGVGLCRPCPCQGAVPPRHRIGLPLLQLRGCDAAGTARHPSSCS
jgi:S-adenosylmethionine:tRNA ribosyltransferase-isomerase